MELYYYQSDIGNFGDELNSILWPALFPPRFLEGGSGHHILGIGTLLSPEHLGIQKMVKSMEQNRNSKTLILGTGVRPGPRKMTLHSNFDVRFVRGPHSAGELGLDSKYSITDPALLCAQVFSAKREQSGSKKGKVGLMPWFRSMDQLNWMRVAERCEMQLIDPRGRDPGLILRQIANCDFIITEALHGAVVADSLGIPWRRFCFYAHLREGGEVAKFKWRDWEASLSLKDSPPIFIPYSPGDQRLKKWLGISSKKQEDKAIRILLKARMESAYVVSSDSIRAEKTAAMLQIIDEVVRDYN